MTIGNLNPYDQIGASSWFVELDGHRILLDSGVHPKLDGNGALPAFDLIPPGGLDAIALTHCHQDHVGSLPIAMRAYPRAHVMMTELSTRLLPRVLHNSINVMVRKKFERGVEEYPLFTHEEVSELESRFQGFRYNREIEWIDFRKATMGIVSPTIEFFDAGHTLGSAGVLVRCGQETLFYTGDCCIHDQSLLKGAQFDDVKADVLILETTRGSHNSVSTHAQEITRFSENLVRAQEEGRSVLIPVFALGRTQEILLEIYQLVQEGRLNRQQIFVGGLGRVFTEFYDLLASRTSRNYGKVKLTRKLDLRVPDPKELETLDLGSPRILVLTAGMMNEHTPAHDMALRFMSEERGEIFFVGYADPESPAGRLKVAQQNEPFFFSDSVGNATCRCQRKYFDLTGHSYREELLQFVERVEPRTVVLAHGSPESKGWIAEQLAERYPQIRVLYIKPNEFVDTTA